MIINEKGLVKALKKAYKRSGYTINNSEDTVILYTDDWYIRAEWDKFPRKALATIVEHMGTLPTALEALNIREGFDPQVAMPEVVGAEVGAWVEGKTEKMAGMVPVACGGAQLFQTAALACYAVQPIPLGIVEEDVASHIDACVLAEDRLAWVTDGEAVVVRAARPSAEYWTGDSWKTVWAALEGVDLHPGGDK